VILIDREITKDFFRTFLVFQVILAFVFLIDTLINSVQDLMKAEGSILGILAQYYVLRTPLLLLDVAPIGCALTVLWVILQKARSNELLALFAGGVSPLRVAFPLLGCTVLVAVGYFGLRETVAVGFNRQADVLYKVRVQQKNPDDIVDRQNIHRRGVDNRYYFVERLSVLSQLMHNVSFILLNEETRLPQTIIRATQAQLVPGSRTLWTLKGATVRQFDQRGRLIAFQSYDSISNREVGLTLEEDLIPYLSSLDNPAKMSYFELGTAAEFAEAQGLSPREFLVKRQARVAFTFGFLVLSLVVCGLSLKPSSGQLFTSFGNALLLVVAYYTASLFSQQLAVAGFGIPVVIMVWLPNAVFLLFGLFLVRRLLTQAT
jgi:lipopolysaccharide export system permease protein